MAKNGIKRIGVLTGGGDCPGLNAVIRVVTKAAILHHDLEVYGIEDGFLGLIEDRVHPLDLDAVSNILTQGGTILGTTNKYSPRNYTTGHDADGKPIVSDVTDRVVENVKQRGLDVVVCIGGDGTMSGAAPLIAHGVNIVGVPKTIDNDLMHCDPTFGFTTAVQTATEALDRVHSTASSHHRIMIVEVMGRNAGWLALHAGIASGADVILIPEIPYDTQVVIDYCEARSKVGKRFTIIAIAEGAHPAGGQQVVDRIVHESADQIRLGGVSTVLADDISDATHKETRAVILGHIQRGGTPVAFDRVLAMQYGYAAIELIAAGRYNEVVVAQDGKIPSVPLTAVADRQRTVPLDHPLLDTARSVGTCLGEAKPR